MKVHHESHPNFAHWFEDQTAAGEYSHFCYDTLEAEHSENPYVNNMDFLE